MSSLALFLNPQIRDYATANGLTFTNDEVEQINERVNAFASLDGDGKVKFDFGQGPMGSVEAAIGAMAVGVGRTSAAATSPTAPTLPAGANATARALAANAALHEGRTAARAVEAQALIDEHGSPWDVRSINRTRQALVTNLDPALAARLKRQAGLRR